MEALRIALNTHEKYTKCHVDQQNDEKNFGTILSISKCNMFSGNVVIFYSRKCIRESVERDFKASSYIRDLILFLDGIGDERKIFDGNVKKNGITFEDKVGMGTNVKAPPHMNPCSYWQPFIFLSVCLLQKFDLSFPTFASVVKLFEIFPNKPLYFILASRILLSDDVKPELSQKKQYTGYKFSFYMKI